MKMDEINLKLPARPEYMSVARLATAAIANRIGFNIDEIEDLKVAVSEAGNFLINRYEDISYLTIDYKISRNRSILTSVKASGTKVPKGENKEDELSLFIIESVTDKVTKQTEEGIIKGFTILKTGGGNLEHE
jgi:serine/threonine-protein kinase RsbW